MKSPWIVLTSVGVLVTIACIADDAAKTPAPAAPGATELKSLKEKASYAMGLNMGNWIKSNGFEFDVKLLTRGLQDAVDNAKPLLSPQEAESAMKEFQTESRKLSTDKNKAVGGQFLTDNAKKPGVVTLPSGLQYKIITEGAGPKPKATDTVVTNYRGTLIDGTEFDSSYSRNEPAEFPVNGVIKGWTEALQLMGVGAKWELFVPSELAYGERGAGGKIGPHATLIFEVELLQIK